MINEFNPSSFEINKECIILYSRKKRITISLSECAQNYSIENNTNSLCVATRDITCLTFIFYSNPKTKVVLKDNLLWHLFKGRSAVRLFLDLERAITELGYTSFDLS